MNKTIKPDKKSLDSTAVKLQNSSVTKQIRASNDLKKHKTQPPSFVKKQAGASSSHPENEKTQNLHDLLFKEVFSKEKYCVDIFRLALRKKEFHLFDWETLKLEVSTFVDKKWREKRMDLIISVKLKQFPHQPAHIIFLLEHKSQSSPDIMKQLLHYQTGIYDKTLNPVIAVVLYSGRVKKWKGPLSFHDYLEFHSQLKPFFKENVLNFKIRLLNLRELDEERFSDRDLTVRPIFYIMANIWNVNEKVIERMFTLSRGLAKKEKELLLRPAVSYVRHFNPRLSIKIIYDIEDKVLKDKKEATMSTLWEGAVKLEKEESRKKGLQEGRQEGLQEGRQEGREEGRMEGRQERDRQVILNMLKENADMNFISKVTGLSSEEIQKLKKKS